MNKKDKQVVEQASLVQGSDAVATVLGERTGHESNALANCSTLLVGAQTAQGTENIPQFGMPADARGWRQFLVDRPCPGPGVALLRRSAIPCVVWARVKPGLRCPGCQAEAYSVLPQSARAVAAETGQPLLRSADRYSVCSSAGGFIE